MHSMSLVIVPHSILNCACGLKHLLIMISLCLFPLLSDCQPKIKDIQHHQDKKKFNFIARKITTLIADMISHEHIAKNNAYHTIVMSLNDEFK